MKIVTIKFKTKISTKQLSVLLDRIANEELDPIAENKIAWTIN